MPTLSSGAATTSAVKSGLVPDVPAPVSERVGSPSHDWGSA